METNLGLAREAIRLLATGGGSAPSRLHNAWAALEETVLGSNSLPDHIRIILEVQHAEYLLYSGPRGIQLRTKRAARMCQDLWEWYLAFEDCLDDSLVVAP